ncbi:ammonium transporter [Streptomyces profundus]|uniref:ammonium transporter n=1 Tax=Streptomyces profundus TaxID=2867410 RepID=UPI001D167089|nr:ammonium transporter [Streptomyces sp. MA3_2.13]UED86873.1 ammonium transporter [Streptomyces sp. MA3_2.13]
MEAADIAFVVICAAMVMLMTPGLAFFYGGMIRVKSALNMLMMCFIATGISSVLWVLYGFSITFGDSVNGEGNGIIGNFDYLGFSGMLNVEGADSLLTFAVFQLMFAVLTPALISGALADRVKFSAWAVFIALWVTVVYFPVAHWVWGENGWIGDLEIDGASVIDFAGGTAVHINAGIAALAAVLVIGKRIGFKKDPMRPHNLPMVLLGAALLWFGWFGFNAGSELAANGTAALMALNTMVATGTAVLGWLAYERVRHGAYTTLGAASGAIAGLVAITPSGANVDPIGAILIGLVSGVVCAWGVSLKYKLGYDDSLDVVGVHLFGGIVGTLLVGFLAVDETGGYDGGFAQFAVQAIAAIAVMAYSFVVTWILAKIIDSTMGFRASEEEETAGLDLAYHAETGYDFSQAGSGSVPSSTVPSTADTAAGDKKVDA